MRSHALAVLIVCVCVLVSLEFLWRSRGVQPASGQGDDVWRREFRRTDDSAVALVGSSRTLAAVDPSILSERLSAPVTQLSINGGNPLPVFAAVVGKSPSVVLVEYMPSRWFGLDEDAARTARGMVNSLDNPSLVTDLELQLQRVVKQRLVFAANEVSALSVLRTMMGGKLPGPRPRTMRADRFLMIDASLLDADRLDRRWEGQIRDEPIRGPEAQSELLARVAAHRREIESRGGKVFFFRPPSCDRTRAAERERFPRDEFYASAQASVGGVWWHFEDFDLQAVCVDGSHVDPATAERMTSEIAAWIERER